MKGISSDMMKGVLTLEVAVYRWFERIQAGLRSQLAVREFQREGGTYGESFPSL